MSVKRWLVLDEIGPGFKGLRVSESRPLVAVRLVNADRPVGTTEWLTYDEVVGDRFQVWDRSGGLTRDEVWEPAQPLHTQLPFDRRSEARALAGEFPGATGRGLVPVLLVAERAHDAHVERAVYGCSRIRQSGMLFSRIWTGEQLAGHALVDTVSQACAEGRNLHERFSDESAQSQQFEDGVEIELKFTLLDEVSPWVLASDLAAAVQCRDLDGFLPDLGNELQRWSYEQDTFEVAGPAGKSGYVAFMHYYDGTYIVKYKFFEQDTLRRIEKFDEGVVLEPEQFADYVRSKIPGAEIRALPHLTRARFDVNVESALTGHFFGLEVDEVRAGGRVLRQLEIEYHKSRACHGVTADTVEPELFRLSKEAERLLGTWGVRADLGYLSKLSFLKEAAAADTASAGR
ncbi:hypothetical protein [Streptomyces heilongjiangensis]|uniref:T4 RNA ligase 1-like N-terminal domain-containing protein n=1 Tax=Streptomyces heilongjiangensis TaxID=945052 RepID=A0ABW1BIY4_9ACTN|nr:hypothetical protein [Streptomyces heilongjiangensis]MDC2952112.1 hypothetical protein [Streptomyces heilongjiangensis]